MRQVVKLCYIFNTYRASLLLTYELKVNKGHCAPRCPATLPLILNGHEGHHHLWSPRDPDPRLRFGLGKIGQACEDNPFIH
jgi:hypothetical protein